ncbi:MULTISPECIES: sulfite exporter TauE/SafE family protein [Mycobacterium]|uniref:Probable membrane transporter protein n=1 Tax=Mycobacterium paragordonae TaxID=1389713 RepID=A0AAJ1S8K2_9MYCO|nr:MULTISPECIES: sulfite exporter TauE/SafE family protein [Mycobacterium]MDP7739427.1 sulfite exporter TauE/SafE family protein [Mycobacterium paragordonae]GFG82996.1 UPF0721 transmembrane protein [Mycobacterium paragordonae]
MSTAALLILSLVAGVVVAVVTAPVGVSGAVFLLPIQLSVLHFPNPTVTPTNLLFNVVAIPGALARYRRRSPLRNPLTTTLLLGTVPGVILGAVVRVTLIPGPTIFRLLVAAFLLPLGIWLLPTHPKTPSRRPPDPPPDFTITAAVVVGTLGGIYGIGGGSLLSPILIGRGMPMATVAPAALLTTFITSIAGAATYLLLAITTAGGNIAPYWTVGICAGTGGLIGAYLGALLQPHLPVRVLRITLGASAIATASLYLAQAGH